MALGSAKFDFDIDPISASEARDFFRTWQIVARIEEIGLERSDKIKDLTKRVLERFRGQVATSELLHDIQNMLIDVLVPYIEGQGDLAIHEFGVYPRRGNLNVNLVLAMAHYQIDVFTKFHPHIRAEINRGLVGANTIRRGSKVVRRDTKREVFNEDTDFFGFIREASVGEDLDKFAMMHDLFRNPRETDQQFRDRIRDYQRGY